MRVRTWRVHSIAWWLVVVVALSVATPVNAQEIPGGGSWAPAAGAAGDNTYGGFVDRPADGASIPLGSSFHVSGWIVDTQAEGWAGIDDVQVLNGSTSLAHGTVANSRPDVAAATGNPFWAASGFDVLVPGGALQAGPANLTVVAHTPGKGSWSKPLSVNVSGGGAVLTSAASSGLVLTILVPGANENVQANHDGHVRGVAFDTRTRAELGVGVDRVEVFLDGPRGTEGSQNLGTAAQTDNQWSLAWEPTKFDHVMHHVLWVYARSSVTGEERLANQEVNIIH